MEDLASEKSKYGIVMVGKHQGELVVVAPWNEGRFVDGEKAYTLAKGARDVGETRTLAANREFGEETGIDMTKLPGAGQEKSFTSDRPYGRAKIVAREEMPEQTLHMIAGATAVTDVRMGLDIVVVEHIADLVPHLKHAGQAFIPAQERAQLQGLPNFAEMLEWMQERGFPKNVRNREEFDDFIMVEAQRAAFKPLFRAYREHLTRTGKVGDHAAAMLKLDDKVNPLAYMQEGTDLLPARDYLGKMQAMLERFDEHNPSFLHQGRLRTYWRNRGGPAQPHSQLYCLSQALDRAEALTAPMNLEGGSSRAKT
mgnify:CR=1 FL=1